MCKARAHVSRAVNACVVGEVVLGNLGAAAGVGNLTMMLQGREAVGYAHRTNVNYIHLMPTQRLLSIGEGTRQPSNASIPDVTACPDSNCLLKLRASTPIPTCSLCAERSKVVLQLSQQGGAARLQPAA